MNSEIIREHFRKLTLTLLEKKITISAMESCTGGQFMSLITDTPGASEITKGGFVTYSNEAKIMQGVNAQVIERYSVYSKETAIEMAKAVRKNLKSDIGIGITGTFANIDPQNSEASVLGRVFFAIATENGTNAYEMDIADLDSRLMCKLMVCEVIYGKLISLVSNS